MTERQTRRRRRAVPAASLPRPVSGSADGAQAQRASSATRGAATLHHREHHITKDYSYVKRDLITIAVVGTVVMAFMVALAFIVL